MESLSDDELGVKLRLELPGFSKDEVKLSIDEGILSIVAETEDEQRSFLSKQERRLKISDEADTENIKAKLENGILYLEIPHRAKAEPKTIRSIKQRWLQLLRLTVIHGGPDCCDSLLAVLFYPEIKVFRLKFDQLCLKAA